MGSKLKPHQKEVILDFSVVHFANSVEDKQSHNQFPKKSTDNIDINSRKTVILNPINRRPEKC
jgi:hypothetical protein